jgi:hypothetical protein
LDEENAEFTILLKYTKCLYMNLTRAEVKQASSYTPRFVRPGSKQEGDYLSGIFEREFCERYPGWGKWRKLLLHKIWQHEEFTNILLSLGPRNLPDSALYFLKHFERLINLNFSPTNDDIFRMRKVTTGVHEIKVSFEDRIFRLIDVGGQRNERRKWIHCFDDVSSIIFIASLADYNMKLVEDLSTNRLRESIALFKTFLENHFFKQRPIILFLNKTDIFDEKIKFFDLKDTFEDYKGMICNKEDAKNFIQHKFLDKNR